MGLTHRHAASPPQELEWEQQLVDVLQLKPARAALLRKRLAELPPAAVMALLQ